MISMLYAQSKRSSVQRTLLSTLLIVSMFAAVAPVGVSSATNVVNSSAVQKLAESVVQSLQSAVEELKVIVQVVDKAHVAEEIVNIGGQVQQMYESVEALAASVPKDKMLELASIPEVVRVYGDPIREVCYVGDIIENLKLTCL
ncbi:MAG: hypothetical protein QME50_07015 [Candidatus Bathyarchaeota archaeon]|nr:hypothetical protein [Candidatus Bathyarchaeota archaeon]